MWDVRLYKRPTQLRPLEINMKDGFHRGARHISYKLIFTSLHFAVYFFL